MFLFDYTAKAVDFEDLEDYLGLYLKPPPQLLSSLEKKNTLRSPYMTKSSKEPRIRGVFIRNPCLFVGIVLSLQLKKIWEKMERTMNVRDASPSASSLYWGMLKGLNDKTKRELAVLLINSIGRSASVTTKKEHFFDGLSNAWDDGISPEEEMDSIRKARTSGITRNLEEF